MSAEIGSPQFLSGFYGAKISSIGSQNGSSSGGATENEID